MTEAGTGLFVEFNSRKVLLLTVAGSSAWLKVAVTDVVVLTPEAPEAGDTDMTAKGVTFTLTVKAFVRVPICPSGFVTVTLRAPVLALAAIVMLAVICDDVFIAQEFTVMPLPKLQTAPVWKLLPLIVTATV